MSRVALVSCGASKRSEAAPASDLYTGSLFRAARRDVAGRVPWWIVSAMHALVAPETRLEPYNFRLEQIPSGRDRELWARRVAAQLAVALSGAPYEAGSDGRYPALRLDGVTVELHAGTSYATPLVPALTALGAVVEVLPPGRLELGARLAWYAARHRHQLVSPVEPRMNVNRNVVSQLILHPKGRQLSFIRAWSVADALRKRLKVPGVPAVDLEAWWQGHHNDVADQIVAEGIVPYLPMPESLVTAWASEWLTWTWEAELHAASRNGPGRPGTDARGFMGADRAMPSAAPPARVATLPPSTASSKPTFLVSVVADYWPERLRDRMESDAGDARRVRVEVLSTADAVWGNVPEESRNGAMVRIVGSPRGIDLVAGSKIEIPSRWYQRVGDAMNGWKKAGGTSNVRMETVTYARGKVVSRTEAMVEPTGFLAVTPTPFVRGRRMADLYGSLEQDKAMIEALRGASRAEAVQWMHNEDETEGAPQRAYTSNDADDYIRGIAWQLDENAGVLPRLPPRSGHESAAVGSPVGTKAPPSPKAMAEAGWTRTDPRPWSKLTARWKHKDGWEAAHCGHPTAIRPWQLWSPTGDAILTGANNGEPHVGAAWTGLNAVVDYVRRASERGPRTLADVEAEIETVRGLLASQESDAARRQRRQPEAAAAADLALRNEREKRLRTLKAERDGMMRAPDVTLPADTPGSVVRRVREEAQRYAVDMGGEWPVPEVLLAAALDRMERTMRDASEDRDTATSWVTRWEDGAVDAELTGAIESYYRRAALVEAP